MVGTARQGTRPQRQSKLVAYYTHAVLREPRGSDVKCLRSGRCPMAFAGWSAAEHEPTGVVWHWPKQLDLQRLNGFGMPHRCEPSGGSRDRYCVATTNPPDRSARTSVAMRFTHRPASPALADAAQYGERKLFELHTDLTGAQTPSLPVGGERPQRAMHRAAINKTPPGLNFQAQSRGEEKYDRALQSHFSAAASWCSAERECDPGRPSAHRYLSKVISKGGAHHHGGLS